MEQHKIGNATVKIHGNYDFEKVKVATERFLKKAEAQKKRGTKNALYIHKTETPKE